ncbi:MAG: hypothetical protein ABI707_11205 [Ferruginibacter sp.]
MKKLSFTMLLIGQLAFISKFYGQNIAINEAGSLPDTSAILDVSSTTKGFLTPRMTTTQQNAIPLPANGLLIYNTTDTTFKVNKGTPAWPKWVTLGFGSGSTTNALALTGTNLVSTVNGVASAPTDLSNLTTDRWKLTGNTGSTPGANFLGTTDNVDFIFKTNSIEAMRLTGPKRLLGLNVSNPIYRIQVEDPGGPDADIATRMYNTSNQGYFPSMQLQVAAGTHNAPLPVTSGTILGALHFVGFDGSTWSDVVSTGIEVKTSQNWTTAAHGAYMYFKTMANNTTAEAERMRIDQNGYIGINTTVPGSHLDVKGTLRLSGATSGFVGFAPAAAAGATTYTLPAADGVSGQALTTNGTSTLSWAYPNSPFSWSVTGNTGTTTAANFIGTKDSIKLIMKTNNIQAGQLSPNRDGAVSFGQNALSGPTGIQNTAVGYNSLASNTGNFNTSIGNSSLTNNTSGSVNTATGHEALRDNTTGQYNSAYGAGAMKKGTSANDNTAIGSNSLGEILTGHTNTAVGNSSARQLTGGSYNTGVGEQALYFNLTGDYNTTIGQNSLLGTTGSNNVGLGYNAGSVNTTGISNIFIGENSQPVSTALTNATAIGSKSLVAQSNSMVLGSINGINGALSNTNVGIGTTTPGSSLDIKGTLRLSGATSGYVGFAPAPVAGSTTYTLPGTDGSTGQLLSTNGSGSLSWASATATIDMTATLITNQTYVGTFETAVAGEAVVFGDVLYLDFATKKWKKANANAAATTPVQRMALENIAANASGKMLIEGFIRNDAWSFGAAPVYLVSGATGAITTTQPAAVGDQIQRIGIAFNTNKLHFKPSIDVGEL